MNAKAREGIEQELIHTPTLYRTQGLSTVCDSARKAELRPFIRKLSVHD